MTLKYDAILKKKLTGSFKNDMRNLVNFHASSSKSENLHFDGLALFKAFKVLDEKVHSLTHSLIHSITGRISTENFFLEIFL